MAAAILVVLILVLACLAFLIVDRAEAIRRDIQRAIDKQETNFYILRGFIESNERGVNSITEVLTKASALKVQRDSVFDAGDKIPDRQPSRLAYVPVARRRAAAEMASTGPQTHIEKVRENNAKAMS